MLMFAPSIEAIEATDPLVLVTISGAILDETVYCLGMLKATTIPTTAAIPAQSRSFFH